MGFNILKRLWYFLIACLLTKTNFYIYALKPKCIFCIFAIAIITITNITVIVTILALLQKMSNVQVPPRNRLFSHFPQNRTGDIDLENHLDFLQTVKNWMRVAVGGIGGRLHQTDIGFMFMMIIVIFLATERLKWLIINRGAFLSILFFQKCSIMTKSNMQKKPLLTLPWYSVMVI